MWAGIVVIILLVTIICITIVRSTKKLKESVAQFTRSTVPESLVSVMLFIFTYVQKKTYLHNFCFVFIYLFLCVIMLYC